MFSFFSNNLLSKLNVGRFINTNIKNFRLKSDFEENKSPDLNKMSEFFGKENFKPPEMSEEEYQTGIQVVQKLVILDEIQRKISRMDESMEKHISDLLEEAERIWRKRFNPLADERIEHIKSIPNFWLLSMSSCESVGATLTQKDTDILKYLEDIQILHPTDSSLHFRVILTFRENEYFENSSLWKEFNIPIDFSKTMNKASRDKDISALEKKLKDIDTKASEIKWKGDYRIENFQEDLTIKDTTKEEPKEPVYNKIVDNFSSSIKWSFFDFFNNSDDVRVREIDLRVAMSFKDEIYNNPVQFYQHAVWGGEESKDFTSKKEN